MSNQEWTKILPTEPGWYWWFDRQWQMHGTEVVYFDGQVAFDRFGQYDILALCQRPYANVYWLGPLQVPEVPN